VYCLRHGFTLSLWLLETVRSYCWCCVLPVSSLLPIHIIISGSQRLDRGTSGTTVQYLGCVCCGIDHAVPRPCTEQCGVLMSLPAGLVTNQPCCAEYSATAWTVQYSLARLGALLTACLRLLGPVRYRHTVYSALCTAVVACRPCVTNQLHYDVGHCTFNFSTVRWSSSVS
jgi:hypothetical protein